MQRFERIGLDRHDVRVVALSKDSVEEAARHHARDDLSLTLLADPDLDVIRDYGLEHHQAVEFSTARFSLFGIPLALIPSVKTMAIPTTLLVDEAGIIRWVDQADDYRVRSDGERVLEAVEAAFQQSQTADSTAKSVQTESHSVSQQ